MARRNKARNSASKYMVPTDEQPPCPHAEKSITPNKVKNNFPHAVYGRCSECTIKDKIYLCLKCGKQFCTTHGDKHFDLNNHSLNFELGTTVVRCSKCARELPTKSHSSIERVSNIIGDFLKKQNTTPAAAVSPKKGPPVTDQPLVNGNHGNHTPAPEQPPTEHHISGLKNTGVICFFNSVLQNLVQTPMLRASLNYTSDGYKDTIHSQTYGSIDLNLTSSTPPNMASKYLSFLKLLDSKERGGKGIHAYQVFQEMCSYNGCLSDGQQDAQEAFHAIVHSMIGEESKRRKNAVLQTFGVIRATFKDLPKEKKKKITDFVNTARSGSFIESLFGGTTINQITCLTCFSVSKTLDHFVDLSVPLPKKEQVKARSKQKSSGEGGLSKHQKKKQQKENRKKGKKGRDRKDSSCPPESNENTEKDSSPSSSVSENQCLPHPQPGADDTNASPTESAHDSLPKIEGHDICAVQNGVSDLEFSAIEMVLETVDMDSNTITAESEGKTETITADEVEIEMGDNKITSSLVESTSIEDITIELPDEALDVNLTNGCGDKVVGKLKGGYSASCDSADDSDGMLFSLFDQGESESSPDTKSSVENLVNLMDDLDISSSTLEIDESDFGENSLDACLAQFCREELLTGDNQFSCVNCAKQTSEGSSLNVSCARVDSDLSDGEENSDSEEEVKPVLRDAKCRYFLNTLPPILVVHLKRFTQDHKGFLVKDRRQINYPLELDLDKFTVSGTGHKYKLYGVVDHSGTLHRGHYTAYVKKRDCSLDESFRDKSIPLSELINLLGSVNAEKCGELDKWYYCNDERVSETTLKRVLNADAYLLFYERCLPYS